MAAEAGIPLADIVEQLRVEYEVSMLGGRGHDGLS